jgi:hypothetical protein
MKQTLKTIFKGPVIFYPLLFAAFPILFLYTYNINETSMGQIWLPLAVSMAAALLLWAVLSLILRSLAKAGLATAVFLVFFFAYGRFYDVLVNWRLSIKHAYLLPVTLFIWGYSIYFIGRAKGDFRLTSRWLNVAAVVLIAINLFNIVSYEVRAARVNSDVPTETTNQSTPANLPQPSTLPDIYFIILDEYAHLDTMKEWYDYDNTEFINQLEHKGFFVASQSRTRTPQSSQAIAQVLNMEYLAPGWYWDEDEGKFEEVASEDIGANCEPSGEACYSKVVYSEVVEFLKAQGYHYIAFGNWYTSDRWDDYMEAYADLYFNYFETTGISWVSEFQKTLWNTTMLKPFYYHFAGSQCEYVQRRETLYTLQHLKTLPEVKGPKFVFAHLVCPHAHFVFGPEGEYIDYSNWQNYEDRRFYLGQYIFISREIEKVIDALLDKSESPPIIILQSDHGLRPHHPGIVIGPDEWRKILNAMYLPGINYDEISDSISPVNTFRLIFNYYFGADYPLLEND